MTATLMEPQALDLSTHSRNKCKYYKPSLTTVAKNRNFENTEAQFFFGNLSNPYKGRCIDIHWKKRETLPGPGTPYHILNLVQKKKNE